MCMVEIRNRKTLQSKVNICKSDVKIGDYADSLILMILTNQCVIPAWIIQVTSVSVLLLSTSRVAHYMIYSDANAFLKLKKI